MAAGWLAIAAAIRGVCPSVLLAPRRMQTTKAARSTWGLVLMLVLVLVLESVLVFEPLGVPEELVVWLMV
jgi:hypothetical protein